jgi:hypothetical protein
VIPNISGSTTQNVSSGATGGALDTQGRFSFGGITTTGVGGSASANTNAVSMYVAMGVIAAVLLGVLVLFTRH